MPGGQKGMGWLMEAQMLPIVLAILLLIALQALLGCLQAPAFMRDTSAPALKANEEKCEEAEALRTDGDPETNATDGILSEPNCVQHLQDLQRAAERERAEEMGEPIP